jgi:octaprenyl-diphosphate synthase
LSDIKQIQAPILEEMRLFEKKFKDSLSSNVPLLDKIMHYIIKRKGKQMRPMFVFLSAKLCGKITESSYIAASLIELLHTATLVHDDVVDESNFRRSFFSINALWKNKIAVLVGDFLLSRGLLLAIEKNEFQLLKIVSNAVKEMSEGELLQIEKARKLDVNQTIYFEIIRQKTAALIAACCACGASSTKKNERIVKKLHLFGETVGICFQIKDDLFDYNHNPLIGKPTGIDIREQKMTLPLIYSMNNCSADKKKKIINIIKNHNKDSKKVAQVIAFVKKSGGLDYAIKKMEEYHQKALDILEDFPESDVKDALKRMIDFVIRREQ